MDCPLCQKAMTSGEIGLESSLTDLLLLNGGVASQLVFRQPPQDQAFLIMGQSESKPALLCKTCDLVVVVNNPQDIESECLVCHTAIPARESSCPACGWTYKEEEN